MSVKFKKKIIDFQVRLQLLLMIEQYGRNKVDNYLSEGNLESIQQQQFLKDVLDQTQEWRTFYFHYSNTEYIYNDSDYWATISPCLRARRNNKPNANILKHISHVSFPNLFILRLSGNFIPHIEPLSFIDAPCLQFIDIQNNNLTSLKPLAKTNFIKIKYISINNNYMQPVSQVKYLKRMKGSNQFYKNSLMLQIWGNLEFRTYDDVFRWQKYSQKLLKKGQNSQKYSDYEYQNIRHLIKSKQYNCFRQDLNERARYEDYYSSKCTICSEYIRQYVQEHLPVCFKCQSKELLNEKQLIKVEQKLLNKYQIKKNRYTNKTKLFNRMKC